MQRESGFEILREKISFTSPIVFSVLEHKDFLPMLKQITFTLIGALFGVASLVGILGSGEVTTFVFSGLLGALVGGYIGYKIANR